MEKTFNKFLVVWIGQLVAGIGSGRGIGLMFTICGLSVIILGIIISKSKAIRELEQS